MVIKGDPIVYSHTTARGERDRLSNVLEVGIGVKGLQVDQNCLKHLLILCLGGEGRNIIILIQLYM